MKVAATILSLVFLSCTATAANIKYTLWFGDNVDRSYTQTLALPDNSTLFDAMLLAKANGNQIYAFTWNEIAFGDTVLRSLVSIGGVSNDDDL